MDPILKDKRFAHVAKDPRFRKMPANERRVKIDDRFKHMFKDKKFKMKFSVDKRGKPINLTTDENLKKYYELSDKETSDEEEEGEQETKTQKNTTKLNEKKLMKGNKVKNSETRAVVNESESSTSESEGIYSCFLYISFGKAWKQITCSYKNLVTLHFFNRCCFFSENYLPTYQLDILLIYKAM